MGGESSNSSIESVVDMPTGTETELLRISGAQLFLLDGEESVRMGVGNFALMMTVQAQTPLAAMVAQVADVQWPVGKDGPVLKLANYRYTFSIPGLLYGVILPKDVSKELIQKFESLMQQYCTFEVRPDILKAAEIRNLRLRHPPAPNDVAAIDGEQFWSNIAEDVEQYSKRLAQHIKNGSTIAVSGIALGGEWATWGIEQGGLRAKSKFTKTSAAGAKGDGGDMSPRMRSRVAQARRMSAVAKLLSRTVLKGAISATGHVANTLGTAIGSSAPFRAVLNSDGGREVAVASVDAFAKVAEAVETAGKSLASATLSVGTDLVHHRYGEQAGQVVQEGMVVVGDMINSMWTLNKIGLRMLWGATASSLVLNASRSRGPLSPSISSETSTPGLSSPSLSGGSSLSRQCSVSPSRLHPRDDVEPSSAAAARNEPVLETAQLFPSTSAPDLARSHAYPSSTSPNHYMYMPHQQSVSMAPAYAAYYHPTPVNPTSHFQHYSRPSGPPKTQPFFPYSGVDPSVGR
ncbi:spartin [Marchantia polymorpha subsp. ruderalis]